MKVFCVLVLVSAFLTAGISQAAEFCHPDETEKMVKEAAARKSASYGGPIRKVTAESLNSRKNVWAVIVDSGLEIRVYEVETDDSGCEIIHIHQSGPADGLGCEVK